MIRPVLILLLLIGLLVPADAANRFWVGGTGTWTSASTANWSTTTGGASGASSPGASDAAIFDANSGGGTVTLGGSIIQVNSLDMSAAPATTLTGSVIAGVSIVTNVTLGASVTYSVSGAWTLSGGTFTSNGATFTANITTLGGISFADDFVSTGTFTHGSGTLSSNNHNLTMSTFASSSSTTRTINLGSGTWTVTGTGTVWNMTTVTNLTLNANTSTIKATNNSASSITFAGGGKTFNNLWFSRSSGTGTNIITGANTFADFKDDGTGAHQITFPASATTTMTTFTVSGNSGALISLRSSSGGSQATLSQTSGTVNSDYLNIADSAATGGATWNAGANSVNTSNNTGWIFSGGGSTIFPAFTLPPP